MNHGIGIFIVFIFHYGILSGQSNEMNFKWKLTMQLNCLKVEEKEYQFQPQKYRPSKWSAGGSIGVVFKPGKHLVYKALLGSFKNTATYTIINESGYPKKIYNESQFIIENKNINFSIGSTLNLRKFTLIPSLGMDFHFRTSKQENTLANTYNYLPVYSSSYPNIEPNKIEIRSNNGGKHRTPMLMNSGIDFYIKLSENWQLTYSTNVSFQFFGANWRFEGRDPVMLLRFGLGIGYNFVQQENKK